MHTFHLNRTQLTTVRETPVFKDGVGALGADFRASARHKNTRLLPELCRTWGQ